MYEHTPQPNKKIPYIAVFFFMIAGILLFMPVDLPFDASLWMRSFGIWAFALAFIFADRYLLTSYTYIIEQTDSGSIDFLVSELHFRRRRTVCRISLDEIKDIRPDEKGKKSKLPKKARVFYYLAELPVRQAYILRIENEDGELFIKFSPDARMAELIASHLQNK